MSTAYIIDTKPEPLYTSMQFISGEPFAPSTAENYGSGNYPDPVYPTGAAVVSPYTP